MRRLLLILLLGFLVNKAWSQTTFTNLQQALTYAEKNNRALQERKLEQQVSQKEERLLRSTLLPKVNVYSTAEYYPIIPSQVIPDIILGGSGDKFTTVQFGLPLNFVTGVELSIPLINLEKWETIKKAALQSERVKWGAETAKERLQHQVTELYYKVLVAQQYIQLNKENQQVSGNLLQILEQQKKEGILNPSDYNRARNLSLDVQTASFEYERIYLTYFNALKSVLFFPADEELVIKDSLFLLKNIPEAINLEQRPSIQQAALSVRIAEQSIQEAKKAGLPKVSLNSRYFYQYGVKPGANAQTVHFDASTIGLRLDFPLFAGGYYKQAQQKAHLQLQAAQRNEEQVKEDVRKEQQEWWISYQTAQKKAMVLDQKVQLTADNLRIAQLSLKEGVMEYDAFSAIFNEYIKAKIDLLQNQADGTIYRLLLMQKIDLQ